MVRRSRRLPSRYAVVVVVERLHQRELPGHSGARSAVSARRGQGCGVVPQALSNLNHACGPRDNTRESPELILHGRAHARLKGCRCLLCRAVGIGLRDPTDGAALGVSRGITVGISRGSIPIVCQRANSVPPIIGVSWRESRLAFVVICAGRKVKPHGPTEAIDTGRNFNAAPSRESIVIKASSRDRWAHQSRGRGGCLRVTLVKVAPKVEVGVIASGLGITWNVIGRGKNVG